MYNKNVLRWVHVTSTSLPHTDQNEHDHAFYGLQMGPNLPESIACFGSPHDVIPKVMVTPNLSHSPRRRRISPGFCQQHRPPAHPCADKPGVQPAGTPPPTAHKDRRPLHLPHFLSPAQPTPFLPCHFPICPSSLVIFLFFSFLSFISFRSHLEEGFHQPLHHGYLFAWWEPSCTALGGAVHRDISKSSSLFLRLIRKRGSTCHCTTATFAWWEPSCIRAGWSGAPRHLGVVFQVLSRSPSPQHLG
jgi:hypothetical protein